MSDSAKARRGYQVQSLDRAVAILGCFTLRQPELTLAELSKLTGLPKPTVFRLLASLEAGRLVTRAEDGRKYQVGIRAFELGGIFLAHLSVERLAHPVMQHLTEHHLLACNLGILNEGRVVYIASTDPPGPMRYSPIVGYRHYVHCSGLGKVLIAPLLPDAVRRILQQHGMPALSPYTLTQPDALLAELCRVREQGYAVDNQEGAVGVYCVAVPILDHTGNVVAAMSLSGASHRLSPEVIPALAQELKEQAAGISRQLGWLGWVGGQPTTPAEEAHRVARA